MGLAAAGVFIGVAPESTFGLVGRWLCDEDEEDPRLQDARPSPSGRRRGALQRPKPYPLLAAACRAAATNQIPERLKSEAALAC